MKTLLVYTSKHGCTAGCARLLAEALGGDITLANLSKGTPDLSGYEAVILGAPIYVGNIPEEAKKFHTDNLQELSTKKLGLFICCGQVDKGQETLLSAYPEELRSLASVSKSFGGAISLEKQNFLIRTMLKQVMKIKKSYESIDRQAITAFADQWSK